MKIAKLGEQINAANKKNEEIESVNSELATEISQSVQMMDKYSTEISTPFFMKKISTELSLVILRKYLKIVIKKSKPWRLK